MEQRKKWIEITQIISMVLIVLHHSLPNYCESSLTFTKVASSVHYFSLSVFFFCSGYLAEMSYRRNGSTYVTYVRKRAYRLLTPYIGISLIMLIPKTTISLLMGDETQLSFIGILKSFIDPHGNGICPHLWFLLALFIISLFVPILKRAGNKKVVVLSSLSILFAVSFLPHTTTVLSIDEIRLYAFYFVLGFFSSQCCIKLVDRSLLWGISIACSVTTILLIVFTEVNDIVSATISATGLVPIISFSLLIENHCNNLTNFFQGKTFTIYLLSLCVQNFVEVSSRFVGLSWMVAATLMFLSGIIVPLFIYSLATRLYTKKRIPLLMTILGMKAG